MKAMNIAAVLATFSLNSVFAANPVVIVETSMGNFKIELFEDKAPVTVKNFLSYVDDKFYDGTLIHRVMGKENSDRDFVIQGGGLEPAKGGEPIKGKKTKEPIVNESHNGISNQRGTVAMARDTRADSATSQFFVNIADNTFLDRKIHRDGVGYCVFGKVTEGMDVVDKIKAVKTERKTLVDASGRRDMQPNVPVEDIIIKSVKRETPKQ